MAKCPHELNTLSRHEDVERIGEKILPWRYRPRATLRAPGERSVEQIVAKSQIDGVGLERHGIAHGGRACARDDTLQFAVSRKQIDQIAGEREGPLLLSHELRIAHQ